MKVCLSNRQSKEYLQKANEIKIHLRDKNSITDLFINYPDADIILIQNVDEELIESELIEWNNASNKHLIVCLSSLSYVDMCKKNGIKFYYGFPVSSYYQLEALKDLGVCYVRLDAPLFFDLPKVKNYNLPIRAVPNIAYADGISRSDGVCGTWIRPEDIDVYAEYIDTIEFEDCDERKEQGLYRVYMIDKQWDTDLGLLITNLNHIGYNRMIMSRYSTQRISCKQDCKRDNKCRICYNMLDLANPDKMKEYAESQGINI